MIQFRLVTAQSSSVDADGFWGVQSDAHGGIKSGYDGQVSKAFGDPPAVGHFWMQHSFGFIARPVDPDANGGKGCLVLEGVEGDEGFSWLCHDPRFYSKIPALSQGSSCMYNSDGAFISLDSSLHTGTVLIPVEFDSSGNITKSHSLQIGYDSASSAKLCLNLVHADGMAILMTDSKVVIKNKAGNVYLELNADGIVQNGNTKLVGAVDAGGTGGQPVPNLTLFIAWFNALAASLSTIPGPGTGAALVTAFEAAAAELAATGTVLFKAK